MAFIPELFGVVPAFAGATPQKLFSGALKYFRFS